MALGTRTLEETHEILIAHYAALNPDDDVSAMSFNWLWLLSLAGAVTDNQAHFKSLKTELFPGSALGDMLVEWSRLRGVFRKGATGARKSAAFRVFGTPTEPVTAPLELQHVSGLRFKITASTVVGPGGYVDCDIAAISTGSQTRLQKGQKLTFAAGPPSPDINEEGELQLDLDEGGDDDESEGSLSARHKSRWSDPPRGGSATDYVQWALEVTGIESAFCYPIRRGYGSVHVTALHAGTGAVRILDAPEVASLQAVLDTKRPVGMKGFKVLQVVGATQHVDYKYITNGEAQYEPDWVDQVPPIAHAVTPWDPVTRIMMFTAARPASMQPKGRVIIGNGATGKERVIEALSGLDAVILEADATGDVPVAGSTIYAGGGLCQPVRAAITALFNSLGTANKDTKRWGTWEGNLRPNAIGRVATSVAGVLDGELVTPAALVEANDPYTDPNDNTIGLILPARIVARKKW